MRHSARAECSDTILLRQVRVRPRGSLLGQTARARFYSGDVKDQAKDQANPKPWYTADEKSSKMSIEDLLELIREYHLPEGRYAHLPGLQKPTNYGTKFEIGIYEEHVKSGYRLPLHLFALRFSQHYHMALGQLVPNGWRKLVGLIYLVKTLGYKPDATDFMRVFFKICIKSVIDEDHIFRPRWTLRCDDIGMPDSQISEQHLVHGVLPRDKEKRDAVKEAEEATRRAEELSKQEADYLDRIEILERRLEWVKRKAAEEVKKARDQGIPDFLDRNAGEEWLKKGTNDGLEIYDMGFMKAKKMFAERFPYIPLGDFVMPAVVSPSGETAIPSKAGDTAASHPQGEGPSGDAPEP
ncbi:hypothetical protein RJ639_019203 [Escallonia herrerae]|uniref:Transposase (putative) gypsy type domain-containing protein n=1 Tax=Escallonia herrerae TaxID=1293975 RepID=A0AA88VAU0_9ASTE|nr:hypothetical protein RJ639_019203 [Escallonia herrerae]